MHTGELTSHKFSLLRERTKRFEERSADSVEEENFGFFFTFSPSLLFPPPLTTQRKPIIDNIFLKAARLILLILSLRIAPPSSSPPKSKQVRLFLLSSLSLLVKFEHTMSKVRRRSCLILSGLSDEFVNYEAYQSHHLHNLRFCKQITGKKNELLCRSLLKN